MREAAQRNVRSGFTLIELMVVVAIVAILIGSVFQLMNTVGQMNQKAETASRLQKLQNAISGFYAEYGYYPPVPQYALPDPLSNNRQDDFGNAVDVSGKNGFERASRLAASCQPVAFEFPPVQGLDTFINRTYQQYGIMSPNTALGSTANSIPRDDWKDIKLFKFGLLSFLLPRVELVGFSGATGSDLTREPDLRFYESRQWKKNNPVSNVSSTRKALEAQQTVENRAVSRWLPNLERIVANAGVVLGIDLHEPFTGSNENSYRKQDIRDSSGSIIGMEGYSYNNAEYVLQFVTIQDGWGRELYYYSPPPYQSYRIWSAGKDGHTFPPWIPLNALPATERGWAAEWVKDDIVRFDQ